MQNQPIRVQMNYARGDFRNNNQVSRLSRGIQKNQDTRLVRVLRPTNNRLRRTNSRRVLLRSTNRDLSLISRARHGGRELDTTNRVRSLYRSQIRPTSSVVRRNPNLQSVSVKQIKKAEKTQKQKDLKQQDAVKSKKKSIASRNLEKSINDENKCRLFVSQLPTNVNNSDLYTLFSQFGPLNKCKIDFDDLGRSYGTGLLEYKIEENAKQAMEEYNGAELDGKPIRITRNYEVDIKKNKKNKKKVIQIQNDSSKELDEEIEEEISDDEVKITKRKQQNRNNVGFKNRNVFKNKRRFNNNFDRFRPRNQNYGKITYQLVDNGRFTRRQMNNNPNQDLTRKRWFRNIFN